MAGQNDIDCIQGMCRPPEQSITLLSPNPFFYVIYVILGQVVLRREVDELRR